MTSTKIFAHLTFMEDPHTQTTVIANTTQTVAPGESTANSNRRKSRPPRQNRPNQPTTREGEQIRTRPPRQPKEVRNATSNEASTSSSVAVAAASRDSKPRPPRRRKPPQTSAHTTATSTPAAVSAPHPPPAGGENRRAKFGSGLTKPDSTARSPPPTKPQEKEKKLRRHLPQGDDLTSSLTRALSTPPYPDCPICFSSIRPDQAIWSCSPSTPIIMSSEAQVPQYCWTAFHVKCIRSWADKSVREVEEAWRARGESGRKGDWRCPGCQAKREVVPSGYWCFCHSTQEPKPTRLITPHSCGNSCSRPRESGCGHPCPLPCHPGPCPPCQVTTHLECYCPKKKILSFRCGMDAKAKGAKRDLSCGEVCARTLNCGKHACQRTCHEGECGRCEEREEVRCYCGKETKEVACGEGEEVQCFVEGEEPWVGRFGCDNICKRPFDCGIHKCQKPCHPPSSKPATCPRSPSKVTHCPCGKHTIAPSPSLSPSNPSPPPSATQYTFPARLTCSDPIPTCTSPCLTPHSACGHPCEATCHQGPCPPCTVRVVRPCRCGSTTRSMACYEVRAEGDDEKEILCDKPCNALRACGRHQCRRVCCPLASLAVPTGKKGKKRTAEETQGLGLQGLGEEQGGLHECDLVCGKLLSCGNHRCERRDHRGACGRCLRSSFEELICACGRTVYEPPIPCGTRMECHYPCSLPPPACGHPPVPHECHAAEGEGGAQDGHGCPPCPHLTTKRCACGKKEVGNVRCSLEAGRVSCGSVCGKLMKCGFHHCERLCHGGGEDGCGPCTAVCGKARKSCLPNNHPCTLPCHAPSSCPETDPCQALVVLTCPCGRLKQSVYCGRTVTSPPATSSSSVLSASSQSTSPQAPKCNNDCQIAKRNARLADALGINVDSREKDKTNISYSDELVGFARVNGRFLSVVERAFADFITSEKRTQVLPHMPPDRRKFVHDLAAVYRMDTQMVDQEPHRSVQLLRRIDTRVPSPLLSAYIASAPAPNNLGRLTDLRSLTRGGAQSPSGSGSGSGSAAASAVSWRSGAGAGTASTKPATPVGGAPAGQAVSTVANRGWTSVVAPKPTATLAGLSATGGGGSGSLGGSRTGSPSGVGVGVQRPSSSSNVAASVTATNSEPVPDSWEDDL